MSAEAVELHVDPGTADTLPCTVVNKDEGEPGCSGDDVDDDVFSDNDDSKYTSA